MRIGNWYRAFVLIASSGVATAATAGVDFVPHPGYPAPYYFSGTNSRAFYRASVTGSHNHIARFELYLNEVLTQALDTPYTPGEGGALGGLIPAQESAIMFDSQHYATNGSPITVKCRVLAQHQPSGTQDWFEHTYVAPSRNKAALFGINEFEVSQSPLFLTGANAASTASQLLVNYNYLHSVEIDWDWTYTDFLSDIQNCNTVFYSGHGVPNSIYDGCRVSHLESGAWLGNSIFAHWSDGSPAILSMRVLDIPSTDPKPPFNPSGNPLFNIVVQLCCNTVINGATSFYTYFWPYENGYYLAFENQGYVGFKSFVYANHLAAFSQKLMLNLCKGAKLGFAVQMMMTGAPPEYSFDDGLALFDTSATLRYVYDPSSSLKRWWRPVDMPIQGGGLQ